MKINTKVILISIVSLVVFIILIFSLIGDTSSDLIDAADSVTDANNCSLGSDTVGTALTYNLTNKFCTNTTGSSLYLAGQYDLPLNSLFSNNGIILLILMAGLFILILVVVMKNSFRGKK